MKPFGSEVVVIDNAAFIAMGSVVETVRCVGPELSVTVNVGFAGPAPGAGVPVIAPVEAVIDNPAGSPVAVHV